MATPDTLADQPDFVSYLHENASLDFDPAIHATYTGTNRASGAGNCLSR